MKKAISNEAKPHIEKVLSSISNENDPPLVSRSWKRCITKYNISPEEKYTPIVLEQASLREYQDAFSDEHELARNSVDKLFSLIAGIGYTVLLTDNNGITLDCRYDPEDEFVLKKQGLYTGTNWSEETAGTNGIGTCIVEETDVTINKEDHFFSILCGMTCNVSPIFNSKGKLIATLDASTLNHETSRQNKLISRLVEQYARQIENFYFINDYSNYWLLRISTNRDTTDNITTGILAINEDGIICAANRNAYIMLCKRFGYKIDDCIFDEIFDISFSQLLDNFSRKLSAGKMLRATDTGLLLHFSLTPPANNTSPNNHYLFSKKKKNEIKKHPDLNRLVGNDFHMKAIQQSIRKIINMDLHVLIIGETGTGKEAMARAIHDESVRKNKAFIAINCASIPDSLIESELFGYSSGSFTGALKKGMKGKILESNGGTLFLDEIGDMPLHLQTRLLRVLSEMEVVPLGETSPVPLDIQLISATNKKIAEMIKENLFRSDLYFRLNGISIELPSLQNRTDKCDLIIDIFNKHSVSEPLEISEDAMNILLNYSWPGNIRQLINVAKYSNAMCLEELITEKHIPNDLKIDISRDIKQNTHLSEYDLLMNSLQNNKWNITKVASQLNICRATVYRKMKKHNIVPPNEL